jgi:hypothetical protein
MHNQSFQTSRVQHVKSKRKTAQTPVVAAPVEVSAVVCSTGNVKLRECDAIGEFGKIPVVKINVQLLHKSLTDRAVVTL